MKASGKNICGRNKKGLPNKVDKIRIMEKAVK